MTVAWTDEIDAQLLQMRADGLSYSTIAAVINRSRDVCRSRVGFLNRKAKRVDPWVCPRWSKADLATLLRLVGCTDNPPRHNDIARLLGRSVSAVRAQIAFQKRVALKPRDVPTSPLHTVLGGFQPPCDLPKPSSLTAAFFGDPLPGRSALDQRRAAG